MQQSSFYSFCESPIGRLLLVSSGRGLSQIWFEGQADKAALGPGLHESEAALRDTARQLRAYFAGELETFDLDLAPEGTTFQQKVWSELLKIPYGETISYGELARRIGNPNGSRAVGWQMGPIRFRSSFPAIA